MVQDYQHSWDGLPLSSTVVGSSEFVGSFAVGSLVAVGFVDSEVELPWQRVSPPGGVKQLPAMVKLFPVAVAIVAAAAAVVIVAAAVAVVIAIAVAAVVGVAAAAGSYKDLSLSST